MSVMLFTVCSDNGFALRRQSPDFTTNEFFQIRFAFDEEFPADPRELVRPGFRHFHGKFPDELFAHEFDLYSRAHVFLS